MGGSLPEYRLCPVLFYSVLCKGLGKVVLESEDEMGV
jgi:hypothetical protein